MRRARDEEWSAPASRRPGGTVHPPRYQAYSGAPRRLPSPVSLQHRPRHGGPDPPSSPPTPIPAGRPPALRRPARPRSRGTAAEGGAGTDGRFSGCARARRGAGAAGARAAGGAGTAGREGPVQLGPGLGRDPRPPGGRGPRAGDEGVWVAELGHLRVHQGVEVPALRCRAPPEGQGEPGSTPGRVGCPEGPRKGFSRP